MMLRLPLRLPAMILIAALPFTGHAAEPRYTFLEGGYQNLNLDGGPDGDGFGLGGSLQISERAFLEASYSQLDLDFGVDASEFAAGIGGSLPMRSDLHLVGSVGYASAEVDTSAGDAEDDGIYASGGFRWMATDRVELNAALTYADFDRAGDDVTMSLGGLLNLTPDLALSLGAGFGDDVASYRVGLRYYFAGM